MRPSMMRTPFMDARTTSDDSNKVNSQGGMMLRILIACRLCGRQFVIPSMRFATKPRPCCDECMELDDVTERDDQDDWPV